LTEIKLSGQKLIKVDIIC